MEKAGNLRFLLTRLLSFLKGLLTLLKFVLVGLLNTGIDYGVFLLLSPLGAPYLLAHAVSYTAGLVNSFFWNKLWTFRAGRVFSFAEAARFLVVNLAALLAAGGVLTLGVEVLALPQIAAKAVALPFSFAVNFIGSRLWVFPAAAAAAKRAREKKEAS